MENPWSQITHSGPKILPCDSTTIEAFNDRYVKKPKICIQRHVFPEPFIGDPRAPIYILNLNPGYSSEDDAWHARRDFAEALISNLRHEPSEFPFYYLNPEFADAPGSDWWLKKARWLIDAVGRRALARLLFCVEFFPYHSTNYKPIPKSVNRHRLPSSTYSAQLVQEAIRSNKRIIVMRASKHWSQLIPEILDYPHVHKLSSVQNVSLSPRNLEGFEEVVEDLRSHSPGTN